MYYSVSFSTILTVSWLAFFVVIVGGEEIMKARTELTTVSQERDAALQERDAALEGNSARDKLLQNDSERIEALAKVALKNNPRISLPTSYDPYTWWWQPHKGGSWVGMDNIRNVVDFWRYLETEKYTWTIPGPFTSQKDPTAEKCPTLFSLPEKGIFNCDLPATNNIYIGVSETIELRK